MTREEAIKIVQSATVWTDEEREALGVLIPELAESEDERIRKALIEVFTRKVERGFEWTEFGIPNRSVLDWLEKQKEPQHAIRVTKGFFGDPDGPQFELVDLPEEQKPKLSGLTEFEQEVSDIVEYCKEHGEHVAFDYAKRHAKTLLDLAKKELARQGEVITLDKLAPYDKGFQDGKAEAMAEFERTYFCNPERLPKWLKDDIATKELNAHTKGYNKGYKDAEKFYNDFVAYRNPTIPTTPSGFGCDGIRCTNPHMDCINCPKKTTGGNYYLNTSSGTSTGNTSATDGKEHNPSFTD